MKILKLTTLSILFLSSFAFSSTQTEISHLLKFVSETQCQYERNGTMHTGKEAKNHIQKKYDLLHILFSKKGLVVNMLL